MYKNNLNPEMVEDTQTNHQLNFDAICRTCLREDDNYMKSIFDNDLINIPYYQMIISCSSTQVSWFFINYLK